MVVAIVLPDDKGGQAVTRRVAMSIPASVTEYLDRAGVYYGVVRHQHTPSSMRTAEAAHVSGEILAKGVLLKDDDGYVLAVVPATHQVKIGQLHKATGRNVEPAPEADLAHVFPDCELGAVPALGPAYRLDTIADVALQGKSEIYFEAGDHEELICVSGPDFETLLQGAKFLSCSMHQA
jgi:Ala-tRNA(Pro) deacylase